MTVDESMGWEWFWNGHGMLALKQDQTSSPCRAGDKEPHLYFEPHELPKLIEDLRRAAADGVEMVEGEMGKQAEVVEALRGVMVEDAVEAQVGDPAKKTGGPDELP